MPSTENSAWETHRESGSCPSPEASVIQRARAKARIGKMATPMHKTADDPRQPYRSARKLELPSNKILC